jgi:hypothetical protein
MTGDGGRAYRKALVEHGEAITRILSTVSPPTAAFMRTNFQLGLYPIGWIAEFAAKLETFREPIAKLEAALKRYGGHDVDCQTVIEQSCDCGYEAAVSHDAR